MRNFVIAITRKCGSGATTIAKMLAKDLQISMYDRDLLRLASEDSGISEECFANADEDMKKSLLYTVSRKVYKGELIPPESDSFLSNANLFNYQAKVLNELANRESYVVIGRAADFVLRERPYIFSIFLYAPEEDCIRHEIEMLSLSYDEAVRHVKKQDKYRREYYAYHTGRDWENMKNYDLCINTSVLGFERTAAYIRQYVELRMTPRSEFEEN